MIRILSVLSVGCCLGVLVGCQGASSSGSSGAVLDAASNLVPAGLTDTRWQLVELMGDPVEAGTGERAPFLELNGEEGRAYGFAGCNRFSGGYELDPATGRLSFSQMASTMMACPDMETETAFLEMLDRVDNFSLGEQGLTLNRARMAPLARFVAVAAEDPQ